MSTIKSRKKAAAKKVSAEKAGAKKVSAGKPSAKKAGAKNVASKKSVAKLPSASKSPAKTVAKKTAGKATKVAAQRATTRPAARKTSTGSAPATKRSTAKPAVTKNVAGPLASGKHGEAARKVPAASSAERSQPRRVSAKVAARHFREALQAKQQRISQGPNYPPANAFTGHRVAEAGALSGGLDPHAPLPATGVPAPEALTGANSTHGRGNQGMRKQK